MLNKLVDIQIVFYSLIFVKGSIYVDYVKYVKATKKVDVFYLNSLH